MIDMDKTEYFELENQCPNFINFVNFCLGES